MMNAGDEDRDKRRRNLIFTRDILNAVKRAIFDKR